MSLRRSSGREQTLRARSAQLRRTHLSAVPLQQHPPPAARCDVESPRRRAVALSPLLLALAISPLPALSPPPALAVTVEPLLGSCTDCLGELNGTLNACPLDAPSCCSSYSDDEAHFVVPWATPPGSRSAALDELVRVATGGEFDGGYTQQPFGRERSDVAAFILETVAAFVTNGPLPAKPPLAKAGSKERAVFDGRVAERRDGYVRIVFGESLQPEGPIYDAEWLFPDDDELAVVRVSQRPPSDGAASSTGSPRLSISFAGGLSFAPPNGARALAEALRKALRWEEVPVITGFDSAGFSSRPLWVEKPYIWLREALGGPKVEPEEEPDGTVGLRG